MSAGGPLRVGVVAGNLPRPGVKPGGVSVYAHRLAAGLAAGGHDVRVWSYDPAPAGAPYAVRPLPGGRLAATWLGKRLLAGYLANLLNPLADFGDRQVLLAHGDSLLLPLAGRPVVRVLQGSGLGEARTARTWPRRLAQLGVYAGEWLTALTQPCVAMSDCTRAELPPARLVIPTGVDTRKFRPDPAGRTAVPTVLSVGTLGGRKRGLVLADWFARHVRPRVPDAELVLVTEAPGPPAAGLSYRVGVSEAELVSLYQRAWVYASASTYEGFGLPYLEAMACGTPVVATPNPGSREVLAGGRYGVLAADAELPGEVARLLVDRAARNRLAVAGLERAAELSLDRMVGRFAAVLATAAAGRRVARR